MSKRPVAAVEVAQDAWQGRAQLGVVALEALGANCREIRWAGMETRQ